MEIPGVCPRRYQEHDRGPRLCRLVAFLHPRADGAPIGRIAEHGLAAPVLNQAVFGFGEVAWALGVLPRCARIEGKAKLPVEVREEGEGSRPLVGGAGVQGVVNGHGNDPLLVRIVLLCTSQLLVTVRYFTKFAGLVRHLLPCAGEIFLRMSKPMTS